MRTRITILVMLVAAFVGATNTIALASCLAPPPVDEAYAGADIVFVGTVVDLDQTQRHAVVEVIEVWKGPDLDIEVEISGGPRDANQITSVDRSYQLGETYVFFPSNGSSPFEDNACSSTQPMNDAIGAIQPSDARAPIGAGPATTIPPEGPPTGSDATPEVLEEDGGSFTVPAIIVTGSVLGAAAVAASIVALRRRRQPSVATWNPEHRISAEADDAR